MKYWMKIFSVILILYSIVGGFLFDVPKLDILNESIRNLYFHVTMWFSMIFLMFFSLIYAIKFLKNEYEIFDIKSEAYATTGLFISILGILTGMVWAKFTWGTYWVNDPKLNGAAISLLIYFAYFSLRASFNENMTKQRVSAIYNILAFVLMIIFIGVLPRMTDSLHPGNGGNPGFNKYDLSDSMKLVFYPAVIGWILFGCWLTDILVRIKKIKSNDAN